MWKLYNIGMKQSKIIDMMETYQRRIIACDRGKGVSSFDEMVVIILEEVDFDYPTMNVWGRRALAIAKPTPRGYWPHWSTINLITKVCFLQANEEQARN